MKTTNWRVTLQRIGIAAVLVAALSSTAGAAQRLARQVAPQTSNPAEPSPQPEISAGEIQRLYDAYALVQAQEALQLSDDQYVRFVTRLKALQETRRRHQQARNQILQDLRRLTNPQNGTGDETSVRERLTALRAEDERSTIELRKSLDALDEILDARQQARFRLFEERMEQRKLELLLRARQNARNPARRGRGTS
jgi:hypothetical protein